MTAHDAVSVKAYRLDVVRAFASTDARLGLLLVESVSETSAGRHLGPEFVGTARATHALVPPFDSSVVLNDAAPDAQGVVEQSAHAVAADHGVERVTLTAAPRDASASLEVLVEFLPLDGPTHERRLRHGRPDPGGAKLPAPWNVPASIFDVELDVGTTRITLRVDAEDPRFARDSCQAALVSRMDLLGLVYPSEQTLLTLWCLAWEIRPCRREQARPTAMMRAPARSSARARRDSVRS